MSCRSCDYFENVHRESFITIRGRVVPPYNYNVCKITHRIIRNSDVQNCDKDINSIKDMNICYNCKYWIGGGDWNLSCELKPYMASSNGFNSSCDKFERVLE